MPKYEIKTVVTGADQAAKDLSKPGKAIDDITAKLKAMDEAEQKALKTQRVHGDESQQMASHLSKLTQETKAQGATVEKVTGIKGKWLGAIKNLKHEIPGLGYALGALKNPFVAIIAVIAIFLDSLSKVKQHIDEIKQAVGDGKITTNFERIGQILAESSVSAKQLVEELERIKNRPDTLEEQGAKAMADVERRLSAESRADERAKAGELAGVQDPANRAAIEEKYSAREKSRDQIRLSAKAEIATAKQIRAKNEYNSGVAQLPAEKEALKQAKDKHRRTMELAEGQTASPASLQTLEEKIAGYEETLNTPLLNRSYGQLQLTSAFHGDEGLRRELETQRANLANAQAGNRNVGYLRKTADAELESAQGRFDRYSSGLKTSAEQFRTFTEERASTAADSDAMRPFNGPVPGAYVPGLQGQQRYDAQIGAIHTRLAKEGAKGLGDAIESLFKTLENRVRNLERDAIRNISSSR